VANTELEQVLSNWISQAISPPGQLAEGLDPAKWVAQQFLKWWQSNEVERPLNDAALAMNGIRCEMERMGGWNNAELGEAMHELIHLKDALDELRVGLGLKGDR
jgi:hypothetical protein